MTKLIFHFDQLFFFSVTWLDWFQHTTIFYKIKRNMVLQCCLRLWRYYKMYFNLPNMQYFLGHVTTTKITVKRPIKLQSTNYDYKNSLQRPTAKGRPVTPTTFNRIFCKWINNINLQRASYLYQITVAKKEDEGYLGTTKVLT